MYHQTRLSDQVTDCCFSAGVVRSVPWAALGRTVKVCVTVPMGPAAITLTEAVCVSLVSGARIAETECVHTGPLAFTVSSHVSVRTQTHSGE